MGPEALEIYLNDHLAGATAGQFMSRHLAEHPRASSHGGALRRVADEIAVYRRTATRCTPVASSRRHGCSNSTGG